MRHGQSSSSSSSDALHNSQAAPSSSSSRCHHAAKQERRHHASVATQAAAALPLLPTSSHNRTLAAARISTTQARLLAFNVSLQAEQRPAQVQWEVGWNWKAGGPIGLSDQQLSTQNGCQQQHRRYGQHIVEGSTAAQAGFRPTGKLHTGSWWEGWM